MHDALYIFFSLPTFTIGNSISSASCGIGLSNIPSLKTLKAVNKPSKCIGCIFSLFEML